MKYCALISFLLVLVGCGGSGSDPLKVTVVAATASDRFSPSPVTVDAGTDVKFINVDVDNHTFTSDVAGTGGPSSDGEFPGGIAPGGSYTWHVPADAAPHTHFYYHCKFHGTAGDGTSPGGGMAGVVTVR